MTDIILHKINETFTAVNTSESIEEEIWDRFSFMANNYQFSPAFKARFWDGKIHLYDKRSHIIYTGLVPRLLSYANREEYSNSLENFTKSDDSLLDIDSFMQSLNLPFELHDYQDLTIRKFAKQKRGVVVSPTSSGKSAIVYGITRYFTESWKHKKKFLVIVPTISLVSQISQDFVDYGWDKKLIHQIFSGQEKQTNRPVIVSTWQSLSNLDESWFEDIAGVIVDEAHTSDAKVIRRIVESCKNASVRIGTTGTLKDDNSNSVHSLVLEGLFGPRHVTITTAEMIERKISADLRIKVLLLKHSPLATKHSYQSEIDSIVDDSARNTFLAKLVGKLSGNTLVLFNYVERHGKPLYNEIVRLNPNRPVYYISGESSLEDRENIKRVAQEKNDCIFVCSYGTFSTGISIKQIHNIIFASPYKSKVKILQSIGRGLRKLGNKILTVYDIADDYGSNSYSMKHLAERIKLYIREKLNYHIINMSD